MKTYLLIPALLILLASCADPPGKQINRCYYQVEDHIEFWREWYDPQFKKDHISKSKLEGSDPATFEIIDHPFSTTCYARDKKYVYRLRQTVQGADPATFSFLGEFYARDRTHVFHSAKMIKNADVESFKVFSYPEERGKFADVVVDAKDKNALYNNGYRQKFSSKVAIASFEPINRYYFRDANRIYRGEDPGKPVDENLLPITEADPASFSLLGDKAGYYAKDNTHVFINVHEKNFTIFEPDDLDSFEVLNVRYSKDAKNVYHNGQILPGADPDSFAADGDYRGKDKNGSWTYKGELEKK